MSKDDNEFSYPNINTTFETKDDKEEFWARVKKAIKYIITGEF